MAVIDFILNLAGLLLWLQARSIRFDPLVQSSAMSLAGTLRRAEPYRWKWWHFIIALAALLLVRALLYCQIGSAVNWTPSLRLGAIAIPFRSDFFGRMLLFSCLSFGLTLAVFYLWLLFLSLVNGATAHSDPIQRLVRLHLGWCDRWRWPLKLVSPLIAAVLLWLVLGLLLARWKIIPPAASITHRLEQGIVLGLGAYLTWKYIVGVVLALFLLSSYVYFGNYPAWNFIALTGRRLLFPLQWLPLRIDKVDFTPIILIALAFVAAEFAERALTLLYQRLPF